MEFSGLKLFDYKAAGLAIIASGEKGQPITLRNEETAIIVPPCDVEALAQSIIRLITDIGLRRKLGQIARLEAEKEHSWRHTAINLEKIFMSKLSS
jgi:glycosyltransferase involved in cell wall biosynthesis